MKRKETKKLDEKAKYVKVVGQGCLDDCTEDDCQLIAIYPVDLGAFCRMYVYGPGKQYQSPLYTTWF